MSVVFFLVESATGRSLAVHDVPDSAEYIAGILVPDGCELRPFDPAMGDPAAFETALVGGQVVFVARQETAETALATARLIKWEEVKRLRELRLLVTPTDHGDFDSDKDGRDNMAGKLDELDKKEKLGLPVPAEITWKLANNSLTTLTPLQLTMVGLRFAEYRDDVYQHSWALEAMIKVDAATPAEVDAIDIYSGWPS